MRNNLVNKMPLECREKAYYDGLSARSGNAPYSKILAIICLVFIINLSCGNVIFAQVENGIDDKIKALNDVVASLKEQKENEPALENKLKEQLENNDSLTLELALLREEYLKFLDSAIEERNKELDMLNNARVRLNDEISQSKSSDKQKAFMQSRSVEAISEEVKKIKQGFIKEKQALEAKVFSLETELYLKTSYLKDALSEKDVLKKAMRFQLDNCASTQSITAEKQDLESQLASLKSSYQNQIANLYYYLGLAYTQAKIYKDAIGAYEMSLQLAPENADAHYNLALLCQYQNSDSGNAIRHLRKSFELETQIDKKKKIEALIRTLEK